MRYDGTMAGASGARHRGAEEDEGDAGSRAFGPLVRIVLGLILAVDVSLLAPVLYYGTFSPCNMVALSNAHAHGAAVDEEIVLSDEIARDVFYVSAAWTQNRRGFAGCAGDIGGQTLSALAP
jgi:hypothetical protein